MKTVIVSGAIANKYLNGGGAWVRLSYLWGLKKLGFNVFFVELIKPVSCVDGSGDPASFQQSVNLVYFKSVMEQFGFSRSSILILGNGEETSGISYKEVLEVADSADLLINITGHLTLEPLLRRIKKRVYIDLDPGFTQFWHKAGNIGPHLDGHDFYFTVGENIGSPICSIPTGDIQWRPTRPPVVLEHWPVSNGRMDRFTTVASWRGAYGPIQYGSKTLGLKVHQFRKFIELPPHTGEKFELALDIHPSEAGDLQRLEANNWRLVDPKVAAPDPGAFRSYVQRSGAEFSAAQSIYVDTNSGWFSDRTVRYLASGKPALVQDTGFSRNYPVGEGLVCFHTMEEAVDGVRRIVRDYEKHCRTARDLAETYFDSDRILSELLDEVGIAP